MNFKQMAAFREVMLTGSVSDAARNLNRTQPSVSHTIQTLEDELGMRLFVRRKGRLHPVPEAHYLLEECSGILSRTDTVLQTMSRMKAMKTGQLRVASMPGPSVFFIPDLLSKHLGAEDSVKATVLSRSTDAVYQLVGSQQVDLGLADFKPERPQDGSRLKSEIFLFDSVCAIPAGDPLEDLETITPEDLDGRPMASLFSEHRVYKLTQQVFASRDVNWNLRFEALFFIQLLTFVQHGLACAIVDPLSVEAYRLYSGGTKQVVFRPFTPSIEFGVVMLTPGYRPASILADSFAGMLKRELLKLGARPMV